MRTFLRNLAFAFCFVLSSSALAQPYPSAKVVTMIVAFAAGGPSDAIARHVAQSMTETMKQRVIIENVGGAGGTIGATKVAKAKPDGYMILLHHVALAASPAFYKNLPFDPVKDFEPIGLINFGPMVLVARSDFPASNAKELFAKLKADGTSIALANAGTGSNSHLCGLLLQEALDTKLTEVAYRGTGPALLDLMGGQVHVLCDQTTSALPHITTHKLNAYAVTSANRLDVLPDVPTMIEAGFPGFEFVIWHALYAPKGTPKNVISDLNKALVVAVNDPAVKARFAEAGTQTFSPEELSPEALHSRLEKEVAKWKAVVAKSGLTPQ
jgi:tripartite-type tricarboxylate transporter receptor subunit TctC